MEGRRKIVREIREAKEKGREAEEVEPKNQKYHFAKFTSPKRLPPAARVEPETQSHVERSALIMAYM